MFSDNSFLFDKDYKIAIGRWSETFFEWLTDNFGWFFNFVTKVLKSCIDALVYVLQMPELKGTGYENYYGVFVILVFTAATWYFRRSLSNALLVLIGFLLIMNQGYWKETTETLALVVVATAVCMIIGVPIGIAAARRAWLYSVIRPILDLMQTLPTFVYLIPALILFGLGMVPGLIATVIFAIPAPIRLTRLGIISTPGSLVEAAEAFGARPLQVLTKVELPFALPQIMAGLTQTIMLSLSMVVIAALVGAPGLGVPVVRALNTVNVAKGFEAGTCIVILAIILDRVFRISDKGEGA
ncbi:choline ABC transporter permease subunit [Rhizobium sp. PAMB 3174]